MKPELTSTAVSVALIALVGAGVAGCSSDETSGAVTLELRSARDSYPSGSAPALSLAVHNDSDAPCSVPKHGIGILRIDSVERDGRPVPSTSRPIPTVAPPVDAIRASLTDLSPGDAQALDVEVDGGTEAPAAIRSHVVTPSGGLTATVWPVVDRGRYRVTASLDVIEAASRKDRAPLCAPSTPATVEFTIS